MTTADRNPRKSNTLTPFFGRRNILQMRIKLYFSSRKTADASCVNILRTAPVRLVVRAESAVYTLNVREIFLSWVFIAWPCSPPTNPTTALSNARSYTAMSYYQVTPLNTVKYAENSTGKAQSTKSRPHVRNSVKFFGAFPNTIGPASHPGPVHVFRVFVSCTEHFPSLMDITKP